MIGSASIWRNDESVRWFFVPDDMSREEGTFAITSLSGAVAQVDESWLTPFEITEDQARALAKNELGLALDDLKLGIDETLASARQQLEAHDREPVNPASPITPNAGAALLDFFKALPRIVGQGILGDDARVGQARETMADLQRRLKEAGIDVDDRLQEFPERLAGLRKLPEDPKP